MRVSAILRAEGDAALARSSFAIHRSSFLFASLDWQLILRYLVRVNLKQASGRLAKHPAFSHH